MACNSNEFLVCSSDCFAYGVGADFSNLAVYDACEFVKYDLWLREAESSRDVYPHFLSLAECIVVFEPIRR